jgi:hypothetical protein
MKSPKSTRSAIFLLIVALPAFSFSGFSHVAAKTTGPRLVVILVVDQMRGDYLQRFSSEWRGGFKRLMDQGAWFTNAAYPYSETVTCAGHSTISTGDFPDTHGMIGNNWWDYELNKEVNCTEDPSTRLLAYDGASLTIPDGDSAWRMKTPAFADELRDAYSGSKIIVFSMKARAAVPLAGHHADSVTWLEGPHWVTSDAYGHEPSKVIAQYVTTHPISEDAGKTWTIFLAPPSRMESRGAAAAMVAVGKDISAYGYPSTVNTDEMRAERITVDGKTYEMR